MKFSKSLLKRTLTLSLSCIFAAGVLQPRQMAQAAEAGQVRTQTLAQAQAAWQTPAASVSVSPPRRPLIPPPLPPEARSSVLR